MWNEKAIRHSITLKYRYWKEKQKIHGFNYYYYRQFIDKWLLWHTKFGLNIKPYDSNITLTLTPTLTADGQHKYGPQSIIVLLWVKQCLNMQWTLWVLWFESRTLEIISSVHRNENRIEVNVYTHGTGSHQIYSERIFFTNSKCGRWQMKYLHFTFVRLWRISTWALHMNFIFTTTSITIEFTSIASVQPFISSYSNYCFQIIVFGFAFILFYWIDLKNTGSFDCLLKFADDMQYNVPLE